MARLAEARAAHPEFAGKTAAIATPYQGISVYGPNDARSKFLTDLAEKGDLFEATSFISVLSIPLLVDQLVPKLAAAVP